MILAIRRQKNSYFVISKKGNVVGNLASKVLLALTAAVFSVCVSATPVSLSYETLTGPASHYRYHFSGDLSSGNSLDLYFADAYANLALDRDSANPIDPDLQIWDFTPPIDGVGSILTAYANADLSLHDVVFDVFFTLKPGAAAGPVAWDVQDDSFDVLASGTAVPADANPGTPSSVPEPGTLLLMFAGCAVLCRRHLRGT
jgi:hypothetical protein